MTFAAVLGQRPGVPLKPSPAVVEEILARTGTAREEVLYVGDSGVDIETAAAAGVRSAGVTWGFRDRAELIEWPERIHGLFPPHTVYVDIRRGEKEEERIITVEQAE